MGRPSLEKRTASSRATASALVHPTTSSSYTSGPNSASRPHHVYMGGKAGTAPMRRAPAMLPTLHEELEELELELKKRNEIRLMIMECHLDKISSQVASQILRIPKAIQDMSFHEFRTKFGGDVQLVVAYERSLALTSMSSGEGSELAGPPGTVSRASARKNNAGAAQYLQKVISSQKNSTLKRNEFPSSAVKVPPVMMTPASKVSKPVSTAATTTATTPGQHPGLLRVLKNTAATATTPHGTVASSPIISIAIGSAEKRLVELSKPGATDNLNDSDKVLAMNELERLRSKVTRLLDRITMDISNSSSSGLSSASQLSQLTQA